MTTQGMILRASGATRLALIGLARFIDEGDSASGIARAR